MQKKKHGYSLHQSTPIYLEKVRRHSEPYIFELNNQPIVVLPNVMSPKYDWAGHFMIEELPDVRDKTVLEVGSGCGLVSMAALSEGAASLVAVDINPYAVENTKINLENVSTSERYKVFESDVFSAVEGEFDVIIFNAPYHGCPAADELEKGVADENYETLRKFFKHLDTFLKKDGIVAVGFSTSGDHELFNELCKNTGYALLKQKGDTRNGYQCEVTVLKK